MPRRPETREHARRTHTVRHKFARSNFVIAAASVPNYVIRSFARLSSGSLVTARSLPEAPGDRSYRAPGTRFAFLE